LLPFRFRLDTDDDEKKARKAMAKFLGNGKFSMIYDFPFS